jgi:hypothetical protein
MNNQAIQEQILVYLKNNGATQLSTLQHIIKDFYGMKSGAMYRVIWRREAKQYKKFQEDKLEKVVSTIVRSGILYDNIKNVQEKRENNELPEVNAGLPWGKWIDPNRTIEHKGNVYLRLYPVPNVTENQTTVSWFLNEEYKNKVDIIERLTAAEQNDKKADCFTLKVENVKELFSVS